MTSVKIVLYHTTPTMPLSFHVSFEGLQIVREGIAWTGEFHHLSLATERVIKATSELKLTKVNYNHICMKESQAVKLLDNYSGQKDTYNYSKSVKFALYFLVRFIVNWIS